MLPIQTLVFTCANSAYEDFAPLYATAVLMHSQFSFVEIGVQDASRFLQKHGRAWDKVANRFPSQTLLRTVTFPPNILPNTVRFITPPVSKAEYVYIGDIDIIILEQNFPNIHINHMRCNNLKYSNSVRPQTKRMTGLHFAEYASFYPLPDATSLALELSDEQVLYELCKLKGLPTRDNAPWFRPVHGIHLSPNRKPNLSIRKGRTIPGWDWQSYTAQYMAFNANPFVVELRQCLSERIRCCLNTLDDLCAKHSAKLSAPKGLRVPDEEIPETVEATFSRIYEQNAWRGTESRSGPSSSLLRTRTLRAALPSVLCRYSITTLLDAPCGDFHWMQHVLKDCQVNYIGCDIVQTAIDKLLKVHASPSTRFLQLDITKDPLPSADLFFCRDALFHFSYEHIALVFQNYLQSDCKYILTTSHINKQDFDNTNIKTGHWRWFDLFKPPFNFDSNFKEAILDGGGDRFMYLWAKEDARSSMESFIAAVLKLSHA